MHKLFPPAVFLIFFVCLRLTGKEERSPLGMPALSIMASTASSVALILLLVVLFVLLQPKLKSFHHSRSDSDLLEHGLRQVHTNPGILLKEQ